MKNYPENITFEYIINVMAMHYLTILFYIQKFHVDRITYPCPNLNAGFADLC